MDPKRELDRAYIEIIIYNGDMSSLMGRAAAFGVSGNHLSELSECISRIAPRRMILDRA